MLFVKVKGWVLKSFNTVLNFNTIINTDEFNNLNTRIHFEK